MGIRQAYRYNPEVKQYLLTQNYIGGLNLVDADDVVTDVEQRELLNIDLGNQGVLQNRRGFARLSIMTEIMSNAVDELLNPVSFPSGTIRLVKVAKDDLGIISKIVEYDTIDDFRNALFADAYELVIIYIVNDKLYRLKVSKAVDTLQESVELKEMYTFTETLNEFNSKLSIENVEHLDSIYILPGGEYIYEYHIVDDTFTPLDIYEPNPYDVKYVGFNVLATDPLTYIDDQEISIKAISGVYLTYQNDRPALVVPQGGQFQVNVLYTGTMLTTDLDFTFARVLPGDVEEIIDPSAYTFTVTDTGGLMVCDFTFGSLSGVGEIKMTISDTNDPITFDEYVAYYTIGAVNTDPVENLDLTNFKLLEIQNRLVYYGGKTVWFSDYFNFAYVPNYNYFTLPIGTTDEIVKIVFFRGNYIIFTKEEIYKMSGVFGDESFMVSSVNKFVGCISPNSVKNVGNELIFLSRDGLYKLKSSVFQDNLENVEKIDKKVASIVYPNENSDAVLYDEQYIMYYNNGEDYDALRFYYNIDLGKSRHPFVRDIFAQSPEILLKESGHLFAIKNQEWYIYDQGYTDFMPADATENTDYLYDVKIETAALSLGYPTHQKKYKSIYVKALHGTKVVPLYVTVKVDGYEVLTPYNYTLGRGASGEIEYIETRDANVTLQSSAFLGELDLGTTALGEITQGVHKLSFSGKGKNIKVLIEQKIDSSFGIVDIGYKFKLGKVKE